MIHDWLLETTNLGRVRENRYTVALLPVGATEPHNLHLPYGQDLLHTVAVAHRACERAHERCRSVLCLPPLPFGVDCNLLRFPFAIHVSQATLDAMVREIIASVRGHGVDRFVILNGHGGNDFVPLVRQVQCDLDVAAYLCDWWKVGMDRYGEIFDRPDDHAGQMETSVALHLFPDLVEPERAKDGKAAESPFAAVRNGWVRTSRDFSLLNDHCAVGDPGGASAQRGERYVDLVVERLAEFLVELAREGE